MPRLIFTADVMDQVDPSVDALDPLLLQLAAREGKEGERIREQIEHAAALVPEAQRPRVLGPICVGATDGQVKAAVGGLLLAKMLRDLGWSVEYEPVVATQTPDLLIRKAASQYLVEIRRVEGQAYENERPRRLVTRALRGIRTSTPLQIDALQVRDDASLKPLRAHVEAALECRPVRAGRHTFSSPGVFVVYEISDLGGDAVWPAVVGWPVRVIHGGDADRIEAAINEKLRAYKYPIVIALDLEGVMNGFQDAIDAFYGERKIRVPIHRGGADSPLPAYLGPMEDGMLVGAHRDAARVRERLVALLPFNWGIDPARVDEGITMAARVLENPAQGITNSLDEFDPIPRFGVASRPHADKASMHWQPVTDPRGWSHVP